MKKEKINIEPIGYVENEIIDRILPEKRDSTVSKIILKPELVSGFEGIEQYSHLYILFWLHEVPPRKRGLLRAKYLSWEIGIFSTRLQFRPNPIGLTLVEFIERQGNILKVRGLEAFNGTPVLCIKPYTAYPKDRPLEQKIKVASWANKHTDIIET